MTIADHTARQALLYHYHQLEEGDSATDLSTWVISILGTNTAGDWVRLNEDGSYSCRAYIGMDFDENSQRLHVGDYLVISDVIGMDGPSIGTTSAGYFHQAFTGLDVDL